MDININTPSLDKVIAAGNTTGDLDIISSDGKATLRASTSGASVSFNNGGVGEYANVQMDNVSVSIEHNSLINITAPQVTVDGAQTVTGQEDAQSFKITGTSGNGKEMFRHQSVNATSTGQHTALFAGSDGELYQKNDGNAVTKIVTAVDLSSYETSSHASSTYQPILTSANFGSFVNGLSAKATPIDADFLSVNDTADSNKEKKTTFLQAWTNYFKGKADAVYTTTSAVATQITAALSGYATQAWVTSQGYITNVVTALGYTPENVANKDIDSTFAANSDTKYPSQKAVKTALSSYLTSATAASTYQPIGTYATGTGTANGTNTGDQTITLTGDVTGSGTGSFVATIASNSVTNAKLAQMGAYTIKGNKTASTANASDLTMADLTLMLKDQSQDLAFQFQYQNALNYY